MHSIVYGIPNCDTVKKARTWLADHGIEFTFHDFKKQGVPSAELDIWLEAAGWETLLNRKGTTWRKLSDERRAAVTTKADALELMLEFPSVIKRPVLDGAGPLSVGFSDAQYRQIFA